MTDKLINVAIQVLPRSAKIGTYELVDRAIEVIQKSGLKYQVCPFETVVEGHYDEIMTLLKEVHEVVYAFGAEEMITNVKIQTRYNQDVLIEDKMNKYE
ncbi:MAG: MTH1187 family thiamine-binding protein [Bacteroidota bacterium]|nr:MTH1187 family thiamine-binding protein [Bacteroidota bacterium]